MHKDVFIKFPFEHIENLENYQQYSMLHFVNYFKCNRMIKDFLHVTYLSTVLYNKYV